KPYAWPGNKTLAVWIAPNVEVWHYDSAAGTGISPGPPNRVPDVINYAWREYGMRIGLWRIADVLDAIGVKATVALNSQVCEPYPMKVKTGNLFAIPYCMEINDIGLYMRKGYTGEQYFRSVMDQFEQLYAESAKVPRVMGIPLHPMISGQPLRIKYLERALGEI